MNQDLVLVETSLAEFDAVEAGLVELESKYKGVAYAVATTKGMAEAVAARAEIRAPRIKTEKIREAGKKPIIEYGRALDRRAKEITARLVAIEDPIDEQIKAEEKRKAEEKAERERIEAARVASHQAVIDSIKSVPIGLAGEHSSAISLAIDLIRSKDFSGLEEFVSFAENARTEVIKTLEVMHQATLEKEEREKAEAEARKAEEERLAEERKRLADAQEALRKEQEAARIKREAEEADIARRKAEQEGIELAARLKREAEEKAHREAIEAANAKIEADRLELEKQKKEAERIANAALAKAEPIESPTVKDSLTAEEKEATRTPIEEIVYLVKQLLVDDKFIQYVGEYDESIDILKILKELTKGIKKYEASK